MKLETDASVIAKIEAFLNESKNISSSGSAVIGANKSKMLVSYTLEKDSVKVVELHCFDSDKEAEDWLAVQQDYANEAMGVPHRVRNKKILKGVQKDLKDQKVSGNHAVMLEYPGHRFLAILVRDLFKTRLAALYELKSDQEDKYWRDKISRSDEDVFEKLRLKL